MTSWIGTMVHTLAACRTAWRRARNLRSGERAARPSRIAVPASSRSAPKRARDPAAVHWISAAGVLSALGGAILITGHARHLASSAAGLPLSAEAFQAAMPGASFSVPALPGIALHNAEGGALLVAAGMRGAPPVRVDLCSQMLDPSRPRLLPLRIGYQFADVAGWVARNQASASPVTLRNIALAGPEASDMPQVQVTGIARADFDQPLMLEWSSGDAGVRWIGDGGAIVAGASASTTLRRDGWLVWNDSAALRILRRASAACPQAGELVLQVYRASGASVARALVQAFPAQGAPATAWLPPGTYQVPGTARASLEDQALFQQLEARGLVRLGASGQAEVAPRDLAAWQAAAGGARAAQLASWDQVTLDESALKLMRRLYRMADGEYVRDQVRVFNSERRLLAWRVRPAPAHGDWQASVGAAPVSTTGAMPVAASRLFAELPQGWAPWTRIAAWPDLDARPSAQLTLALPRAALGGETLQVMLIGRALGVDGARMRAAPLAACSGRACPSRDAAQLLVLDLLPGALSVTLHAAPLEMAALAGPSDQQYRHLRVEGGRLAWQALAINSASARAPSLAEVRLTDRHGVPLWSGGAPTQAALDAGLAPLLGIRADHASSVAGMLARLPAAGSAPHQARLSLDLALQAASQGALDCIGMRRGRWDGASCHGGKPAPHGRQAGIVIVDTESGDVLAAAGAGAGAVSAANWNEVRDFDRTNPARSPLRLPAFQHDGGAHRSAGSTFKVISALGLELAARRDPELDALLAGMPLPAINRMASRKGFAFQTAAPVYPVNTRLAHITNYKDQHLDRRAQDGRLGLSQALTYSLNTWFAWSGELSDRSLFGRPEGGAPDLQALEAGALDGVRPIVGMARRLGFEQPLRLDGGLLPDSFAWSQWDALQASASHIDPVHTRHELRQMAIGLRMQVTPLQMALVSGAVGEGRVIAPRLLLELDGRQAAGGALEPVGVRLDRIRAGMKGVVDAGTASGAFRAGHLAGLRRGLSGKTGTAPTLSKGEGGAAQDLATVWFTGWLEPGSLPGQTRRVAVAAFVSHSETTGGEHAAPIVAAALGALAGQNREQRGK
jgi:cell division protein FtsI/penicillin-binding protein 2